MPTVVVIAGPNGAGKSTAAPALLHGLPGLDQFVNADTIARGLSACDPESVAAEAGRVMLQRLKELAAARQDFAFETTLASRSFAPWIADLVQDGYTFLLVYLWLPSPDLCVSRVAERAASGGHSVPEDTIRRRYAGGIRNFVSLYRPLVHQWRLYDNSVRGYPRIVAEGRHERVSLV
ncbi:MAG: AAA family ATPase, partial [Chloroflexi bacterium]|nr:AAA family ATPase [Chloroflexota bacterium]